MAERIITEEELKSMTKTKLVELAKSCDVETKSLTKEQLVNALRKFVSAPSEQVQVAETVADSDLVTPAKELTPADMDNFVDAPAPTLTEDLNYKLQLEKMKMDFELRKLEMEIERDVKLAELQTQAKSDATATYPNATQFYPNSDVKRHRCSPVCFKSII